ncbi:D-alanine--poly(phosphoribitol) ligase subunit 2 [Symmachiella macrocystis]|uniref:D-alanine--poly(Phosphoribitol) ligase subunit 2 n=1 Tax=Symmachiella macrocystis TaxID=2527985 RepID=A0A5C6BBJ0_9PLAN|nr:phosphopantetheine-binding protein [Symmachiella macrocystis]TWU08821.1 D-alanine--poly(phosphoribitol) ligase subunit 2 [Symmachiella macrocystis]
MNDQTTDVRNFILQKIRAAAEVKAIAVDDIGDDFDFFESEIFDSLGLVGLLTQIEGELGASIDFSELDPEEFTTLGGLTRITEAAMKS